MADYRRRIEDRLESNNSWQVWQGVQHLTNYSINLGAAEGDLLLAKEMNIFFARPRSWHQRHTTTTRSTVAPF